MLCPQRKHTEKKCAVVEPASVMAEDSKLLDDSSVSEAQIAPDHDNDGAWAARQRSRRIASDSAESVAVTWPPVKRRWCDGFFDISKFKAEMCWFANDPAGCKKGESCTFAHSVEELKPEGGGGNLWGSTDVSADDCPFFLKGCCWFANGSCRRVHRRATANDVVKTALCREFMEMGHCAASASGDGSESCSDAHGQQELRTPEIYKGFPGYKSILCTRSLLEDAACPKEICFKAHGTWELRNIPLAVPKQLSGADFCYSDSHLHMDHVLWTRRWGDEWFYKREMCRFKECHFKRCLRAHEGELKPRLSVDRSDFASLASDLNGTGGFAGCVHSCCDVWAIDLALNFVKWGRELLDGKVYLSFGIHPVAFDSYTPEVEARMVAAMEECGANAVAWGECGLDYAKRSMDMEEDPTLRDRMGNVFVQQARLAVKRGWPLVVHSREAEEDTVAIMGEHVPSDHPVYIHSFTGSIECLRKFTSRWSRGYIGIAGCITYHSAQELHEIAREVPLDRLLLETDGPYMAPEPYRGEIAHPGHIPWIAEGVAKARGISVATVLAAAQANFCKFYGL